MRTWMVCVVFMAMLVGVGAASAAQAQAPSTTLPPGRGGVAPQSPLNAPGTGPGVNYTPPAGGATGDGAPRPSQPGNGANGSSSTVLWIVVAIGVVALAAVGVYARLRRSPRGRATTSA
jgi:hypothetical protein